MRRALVLAMALGAALPASASPDLTQMSLEQLLDVKVVSASKYAQDQSAVAAAVSVITRSEIRAFGWRTLDEALASLPGIFTTYDRQYVYLGARGFGLPGDYTTRMLVTINGNRVNDPSFDIGPFGRVFPVDMALVERIEYIPGPGGAVYGQNAMLGVINVVTRSGNAIDGAEISAGYQGPQALREGRATWGGRLDNGVDIVLSASAMKAAGRDFSPGFGASAVTGTARGLDGEQANQFFSSVRGGRWSFDFEHGDRRKDDPTGSFLSDPLVAGQFQRDRYDLAQLQFNDSYAGGSVDVLGRLFAGQYRYSSILSYGTQFSYPALGDWRGGEFRLLYQALPRHTLMIGLEAQDNYRQSEDVLDLQNPLDNVTVRDSGYRLGLYGQDEWRIADVLTATLGARVDRNNVTGNSLSPRAAVIWRVAPATTLKALYGRASRAPNIGECCYDDGVGLVSNPHLKGEDINTVEIVADQRLGSALSLRASIYQWRMDDLITLGIDPVTGLPQYRSGDTIEAQGVEISADRTWEAGARLRASLSYQMAGYESGTAVLNSPKLLAKLNFSGLLPGIPVRAAYEWQYGSKRLTMDGTRLGGYGLSNISLEAVRPARGIQASLGIRNLFGKSYAQPAAETNWQNALEQDGRSIRVTVGYGF